MEVKMNKEIRNYQESMFMGLNLRQCIFSLLAIAVAVGIYFGLGKYVGQEMTGWLCILGAAPVSYTHLDVYKRQQYSFCVPPLGKSHRVAVYEACIDALAHMTLEDGRTNKYRLSLGGIAAPKEGMEQSPKKMKRPDALEHFLKKHPEVTEIEICTDNDFAGRWACEQLKEHYEKEYAVFCNLPPIEGADYGDLAKQAWEKQQKQRRERGR